MPYILAHAANSIYGERKLVEPTETVKPSKSLNPITEHGTGVLDRVNEEIGKGRADLTPSTPTFLRKSYEKLTKKQLKQIIKSLPKLRDNFKLTGAGKPNLVDYLEKRCGK